MLAVRSPRAAGAEPRSPAQPAADAGGDCGPPPARIRSRPCARRCAAASRRQRPDAPRDPSHPSAWPRAPRHRARRVPAHGKFSARDAPARSAPPPMRCRCSSAAGLRWPCPTVPAEPARASPHPAAVRRYCRVRARRARWSGFRAVCAGPRTRAAPRAPARRPSRCACAPCRHVAGREPADLPRTRGLHARRSRPGCASTRRAAKSRAPSHGVAVCARRRRVWRVCASPKA